jgi:hypothetical protein
MDEPQKKPHTGAESGAGHIFSPQETNQETGNNTMIHQSCSTSIPQMRRLRRGVRLFEPPRLADRLWDLYITVFGAPALPGAVESGDRRPVDPKRARYGREGRTHG